MDHARDHTPSTSATSSFWSENKAGILIAITLIVIGTAYYFGAGLGKMDAVNMEAAAALNNTQIKVAVADGQAIKLFALASPNGLAKLAAAEGVPIPEGNNIVVGFDEATMMRDEKLFSKVGDKIDNLFGAEIVIGGILAKTGTQADMLHFVGEGTYAKIQGEEGRAFIKFLPDGAPKLFYTLNVSDQPPVPLVFAEGKFDDYQEHDLAGVKYYPVVLGADEARMMRDEKLFSKPGDTIKGFFGVDIVVVGVLNKTGTPLDMAHLAPLTASQLS